ELGQTKGCPPRIGQVQRVVLGGGHRRSTGVVVGCGRRWDESDHEHDDEGDGTKAAEMGTHATMVGTRGASRNRSPVPAAGVGWSRTDCSPVASTAQHRRVPTFGVGVVRTDLPPYPRAKAQG